MKSSYVPDLKAQAAICEGNFARLRRCLPDFTVGQDVNFVLESAQHLSADITLTVIERFRYTASVEITVHQHQVPDYVARQTFMVRVYLDANTAEVVTFARRGSFQGVYPYPNPDMFHADEKDQLNRWLSEWLQLLFSHGRSAESITF
ncbi:DUF1249 domain-containing protein [Salinispirillum marinum]|uniref:DUF1249 domain-containing protein n=2 Tax=Saccharospirillaceae TaxID=255527 RepID=A0ABV8BC94_9GAMM